MKQQLRVGSETIVLRNVSTNRVRLYAHIIADAVNVALLDTACDLSAVNISMKLVQGGKEISTSFPLHPCAGVTALKSKDPAGTTAYGFASTGATARGIILITEGVATKNESLIPCDLIDNPLALTGNDRLEITFNIQSGVFASVNDASSYMYLLVDDDTDVVQADMSLPTYTPVTTDKSDVQYSFPMLSELALLNINGTNGLGNNPYSNLTINSKYSNETFSPVDLSIRSASLINCQAGVTSGSKNNFLVLRNPSHLALYDVKVGLSVDTSLLSNKNNWIYTKSVVTNSEVAVHGSMRDIRIKRDKLRRRGIESRR